VAGGTTATARVQAAVAPRREPAAPYRWTRTGPWPYGPSRHSGTAQPHCARSWPVP